MSVCVCEREREKERVCVREREREKERECAGARVHACVKVRGKGICSKGNVQATKSKQ